MLPNVSLRRCIHPQKRGSSPNLSFKIQLIESSITNNFIWRRTHSFHCVRCWRRRLDDDGNDDETRMRMMMMMIIIMMALWLLQAFLPSEILDRPALKYFPHNIVIFWKVPSSISLPKVPVYLSRSSAIFSFLGIINVLWISWIILNIRDGCQFPRKGGYCFSAVILSPNVFLGAFQEMSFFKCQFCMSMMTFSNS